MANGSGHDPARAISRRLRLRNNLKMFSPSLLVGDYSTAMGSKSPCMAQPDASALASIPSPCRQALGVGAPVVVATTPPEAPLNEVGSAHGACRLDFDIAAETFAMCDSSSDDAESDDLDESYDFDHAKIAGLLADFGTPEDAVVTCGLPPASSTRPHRAPTEAVIAIARVVGRRSPEETRRRVSGALGPQRRARAILGRALAAAGAGSTGAPEARSQQRPGVEDSAQRVDEARAPQRRVPPTSAAKETERVRRLRVGPGSMRRPRATDRGDTLEGTGAPVAPIEAPASVAARKSTAGGYASTDLHNVRVYPWC